MSVGHLDGHTTWTTPAGVLYFAGGNLVNCTVSTCPVELSTYGYRPTFAGSIALIVLYSICGVAQIALGWRYRSWGFMSAMLLGCLDEILGYVGRIMMWQNPWNNNGFIMQIVLITIGPVFFSAAIYVMLYQIIMYISPEKSRFRPTRIYWTFISFDIISLILQAVGGGMSASSNGGSPSGVDIALAGLSIQVITLFCFYVLVIDYLVRSRSIWKASKLSNRFLIFISFLTLATLLIFARCCYRVYELHQGYSDNSTALRNQPLFIGLESVLIILAAYCLIIAHPGPVFSKNDGPAAREREDKLAESKLHLPSGSEEVQV